jgi:hypothetical protein
MIIERLRRLQAEFRLKPHHYNQEFWFASYRSADSIYQSLINAYCGDTTTDPMTADRLLLSAERNEGQHPSFEEPLCGTAACMAGTTVAIFETELMLSEINPGTGSLDFDFEHSVCERARLLLGLNDAQSRMLFGTPDHWPSKFAEMYITSKTLEERAESAIAFIDYLIEHPAVEEWAHMPPALMSVDVNVTASEIPF